MGAQPGPSIKPVAAAVRGHRMTGAELENFNASFFAGAVSWRTRKPGSLYQRSNIESL